MPGDDTDGGDIVPKDDEIALARWFSKEVSSDQAAVRFVVNNAVRYFPRDPWDSANLPEDGFVHDFELNEELVENLRRAVGETGQRVVCAKCNAFPSPDYLAVHLSDPRLRKCPGYESPSIPHRGEETFEPGPYAELSRNRIEVRENWKDIVESCPSWKLSQLAQSPLCMGPLHPGNLFMIARREIFDVGPRMAQKAKEFNPEQYVQEMQDSINEWAENLIREASRIESVPNPGRGLNQEQMEQAKRDVINEFASRYDYPIVADERGITYSGE